VNDEPAPPRKRKRLRWIVLTLVAVVSIGAWWRDTHPGRHHECTTEGSGFTSERQCFVYP
jgi:hypothetical protein